MLDNNSTNIDNLMAGLLKEFYGYEGKFVIENDREAEKTYRVMCGL